MAKAPAALPEGLLPGWIRTFLLPLVAGGDVRISQVYGAAELKRLEEAAFTDEYDGEALRLAEARRAVIAELFLDPPEPKLDDVAVRLGVAVQALLFLSHPAAHAATVRRGKLRAVADWAQQLVEALPEPETVDELGARHSIAHQLLDLGRDDVRVSFWAGRQEFRGAEPPARLLKWQRVRRVREERWRTHLIVELLGEPAQRRIVEALLAASPLTDLVDPLRPELPFELAHEHLKWVGVPQVARALAYRWLELGLGPVAGPLTGAFFRLCDRRDRPPGDVGRAAALLSHLVLCWLLGRPDDEEPARLASAVQLLATTHPGMRDLLGLFAVAQHVGVGRPADLARDRRLLARADAVAQQARVLIGTSRVLEIEGALVRGSGRPLAVADPA